MIRINNYWIDEVLRAVIQNRTTDAIIGTLDELNSATVSVSAESTDITDHKGNLVRRIYRSKSGSFSATNAYLSTIAQNLGSGSDIMVATDDAPIEMPKMEVVVAGGSVTLDEDFVVGSIHVQGLFKDGANGDEYEQSTAPDAATKKYGLVDKVLTVPEAGEENPIQYVVLYKRNVKSGIALKNEGDKFPKNVKMTLHCSYYTPCDELKSCYLYIPSFQPSPETEISLDSENQTMDFSGDILLDPCGTEKLLYVLYFPEDGKIVTGTTESDPTP